MVIILFTLVFLLCKLLKLLKLWNLSEENLGVQLVTLINLNK